MNDAAVSTVVTDAHGASSNPYGRLLAQALTRSITGLAAAAYRPRLLFRKPAPLIWHMHWPESAVDQQRLSRALLNGTAFALAVRAARWRGIPIVWTVHNLEPHDAKRPRFTRAFMRWFAGHIDGWISLSNAGLDCAVARFPTLADLPHVVVPHGHYGRAYPEPPDRAAARKALGLPAHGRVLLAFGRIRRYKNIPELAAAFAETPGDDLRLIIAGEAPEPALAGVARQAAARDPRITLRLGAVAAADVSTLFAAADGFVLAADALFNSGSVVLALTFGVPVLVPDTGVMRELRAAAGECAVQIRNGPVAAPDLARFVAELDVDRPAIAAAFRTAHAWEPVGQATAAFYRSLA